MNRSLILSIAALCVVLVANRPCHAQGANNKSPFYARLGFGYDFVHAGQTDMNGAGINGSETLSGNSLSVERKRGSFGSGFSADLAGGYMINRNIGIELGVHAILAPITYTYQGFVPQYNYSRVFTREMQADLPVYIIPAVVLTTGDKLQVYGRAGLVLPVSDKMTVTETQSGLTPFQTTDAITTEVKNHFSLGFRGAGGMAYVLSEHLSFWGEINAISRNAYIKRSEITAYTQNGQDALPAFTTNQKVTEYDFDSASEYPPLATEPNKQPTFSIPFSSIGLSVGLKYAF